MNVSKHAFLSPPPISLSPMHVHVHERINAPPQKASLYKAKNKGKSFSLYKSYSPPQIMAKSTQKIAGNFVKKTIQDSFQNYASTYCGHDF